MRTENPKRPISFRIALRLANIMQGKTEVRRSYMLKKPHANKYDHNIGSIMCLNLKQQKSWCLHAI